MASYRVLQPAPHRAFDPGFNSDTETFDREVTFFLELALTKDARGGSHEIALEVRYQSCSDKICIPPVRRRAAASLIVDPAVQRIAPLDSGRLLGGVAGSANTAAPITWLTPIAVRSQRPSSRLRSEPVGEIVGGSIARLYHFRSVETR